MSIEIDHDVLEMYAKEDLKAARENGESSPDPSIADLENWLDRRAVYVEWEAYAESFERLKHEH